ncbi:MAG: superfamily protein [Mucilaginibacter sp.]|nr:superfamily protein [Mucilaginibacter sp.]
MNNVLNDSYDTEGNEITRRSIITVFGISLSYLLLSYFLIGFKSDQVVLVAIINSLFFLSSITRKFIKGFSIFIVYWVIFDYMKAFPNYNYNIVHIQDLYNYEKHFFGINFNGEILTPNEYLRLNGNAFLDVVCGIFYLCWIPVPLLFATFLFFTNRKQFLYFSLTFLAINLLGFAIYYLYPAAPPWYVQLYGFKFHAATPVNIAGLAKFDSYFHTGIFKSIYAKSSNVFAAMPSLHSSYPLVVFYYSVKNRLGLINICFVTVMLGIWFTAVYASHHYVLDVLAGIICGITGILIFNFLLIRVNFFRKFVDKFEKSIQ